MVLRVPHNKPNQSPISINISIISTFSEYPRICINFLSTGGLISWDPIIPDPMFSSFQNINMFHLQEKEEIFDKAYID